MKVLYSYTKGMEPLQIQDGGGVQRVLLIFKDNGKTYCYFTDDYLMHTYLNIIVDTKKTLTKDNLIRIEDDNEFYSYTKWINDNYNYDGIHQGEQIDGHDKGGAVLVDTDGKALIK